MSRQGVLGFDYERETTVHGSTSMAGLPLYLDLLKAVGIADAVREYVGAAGEQGWMDIQMMLAVIFLNLAGGDCMSDLDRLEGDAGFKMLMMQIEREFLTREERRAMALRWRRERGRAVPSPRSVAEWLERFHDPATPKAAMGHAVIPAVTGLMQGLWRVNQVLLEFMQTHRPSTTATLDMDATLIGTNKRDALFCYKKFKAYQPLNCWWAEHGQMVYSEFRDGNVPAGHEQLRVLKASLAYLPKSVKTVRLRSDTAGYQEEFVLYCGEGRDARFGVIEFAIGADVTAAFRAAALATAEDEWKPLTRMFEGQPQETGQEWAEVCYVPTWAGYSRNRADYRFLAVREKLDGKDVTLAPGEQAELPFPTQDFGQKGTYKLFGAVTNLKDKGDDVIRWLRERCGKSEEVHAVAKNDLAGGQLPSNVFGANAAWWTLTLLSHNLHAVMQRLVLGGQWVGKRMKGVRFRLINLPGRVVRHARRLIIRVAADAETLRIFLAARKTILKLAPAMSG